MAQNDFEDLNVMSLTETKSHRAPTSESLPQPIPEVHPTIKWATAVLFGALGRVLSKCYPFWSKPLELPVT